VDQRGLGRGPKGVDVSDDAGVNAGAVELKTAAGESGQELHIFIFRGAQRRDAVGGEVALVVEGSGIAEVARHPQLDGKPDAFTVVQKAHGWGGCFTS